MRARREAAGAATFRAVAGGDEERVCRGHRRRLRRAERAGGRRRGRRGGRRRARLAHVQLADLRKGERVRDATHSLENLHGRVERWRAFPAGLFQQAVEKGSVTCVLQNAHRHCCRILCRQHHRGA